MNSETNSRRSFLRQAAASIGLVLTAPAIASIVASCEYDESVTGAGQTFKVDMSTLPELDTVGAITITNVPGLNSGQDVFISRIGETDYAVFSNICTHQGCPVGLPLDETSNCECPCHAAIYSRTDGKVLQQPNQGSATDLVAYRAEYREEENVLRINGTPENETR